MKDEPETDPTTGPGSTSDPNQANRTGIPSPAEEKPDVRVEASDPEDPGRGPGSTSDPNQSNRT